MVCWDNYERLKRGGWGVFGTLNWGKGIKNPFLFLLIFLFIIIINLMFFI